VFEYTFAIIVCRYVCNY